MIKAAAEEPEVERIFVNAAIKKALCETHKGEPWMTKVEAYWGHNYHFHVRLAFVPPAKPPASRRNGSARRRLRQVARMVVHRRGAAPSARSPRQAEAATHASAQLPPECRQVVLEK